MSELAKLSCGPCTKDTPKLQGQALMTWHDKLGGRWQLVNGQHLEKEYTFNNFVDALAFTNAIGALAEAANHHPDIYLSWGKVKVTLWTHKINGLSENDFILAAQFDQAYVVA